MSSTKNQAKGTAGRRANAAASHGVKGKEEHLVSGETKGDNLSESSGSTMKSRLDSNSSSLLNRERLVKPAGWHAFSKQQLGSSLKEGQNNRKPLVTMRGLPSLVLQSTELKEADFPALHAAERNRQDQNTSEEMSDSGQTLASTVVESQDFGSIADKSLPCSTQSEPDNRSHQILPDFHELEALDLRQGRRRKGLPSTQALHSTGVKHIAGSHSAWQVSSSMRPKAGGHLPRDESNQSEEQEDKVLQELAITFPQVDVDFLQEVLDGVGWNNRDAERCLQDMGLANRERIHGDKSNKALEKATTSAYQELNSTVKMLDMGHPGTIVEDNMNDEGVSSGTQTVAETDEGTQEDDLYHMYRGSALKVSRARSRHARSAANAFMNGDHRRARELSRTAREEERLAEALHSEAAERILQARNAHRPGGIYELDLHGLHGPEAVSALWHRLSELEHQPLHFSGRASLQALGQPVSHVAASKAAVLHRPELTVITGQGKHSKGDGGAALPSFITSFLVENGYSFRQAKPGVFAVRPKVQFTAHTLQ